MSAASETERRPRKKRRAHPEINAPADAMKLGELPAAAIDWFRNYPSRSA